MLILQMYLFSINNRGFICILFNLYLTRQVSYEQILIYCVGLPGNRGLNKIQGQNDRFLPCQLRDSIQQPFGYWPNALTTRLPAAQNSLHVVNNLSQPVSFGP